MCGSANTTDQANDQETFTCIHDVLKALADAIETSDPSKREALAAAIDGYTESSPEDFYWAVGVQAPSLLNQLVTTIDMSCRHDAQPDNPQIIRLEDHKPQGNA